MPSIQQSQIRFQGNPNPPSKLAQLLRQARDIDDEFRADGYTKREKSTHAATLIIALTSTLASLLGIHEGMQSAKGNLTPTAVVATYHVPKDEVEEITPPVGQTISVDLVSSEHPGQARITVSEPVETPEKLAFNKMKPSQQWVALLKEVPLSAIAWLIGSLGALGWVAVDISAEFKENETEEDKSDDPKPTD